jgi:Bacterial protein of unknown function (DUF899)
MAEHRTASRDEWLSARRELLDAEKEHVRRGDELARRRQELPWVPVEKEYVFETDDGRKMLADRFDGRSQLVVYHFMFGPSWEAGCPVCSSITDTLAPGAPPEGQGHQLLLASRAPLEKLAYRERMGWGIDWVSSGGSDFNRDLGLAVDEAQVHSRPCLDPARCVAGFGEQVCERHGEAARVGGCDQLLGVRPRPVLETGCEGVVARPPMLVRRPSPDPSRWPGRRATVHCRNRRVDRRRARIATQHSDECDLALHGCRLNQSKSWKCMAAGSPTPSLTRANSTR